ncbi:MAG: hypothetical protein ACXAEU_05630 [Candidatus Hodarchaeales archaeon]|jgi:large subunit ribosomal protein L38e
MPEEIFTDDEFQTILPRAQKCLVYRPRKGDKVKVKLRTKKRLYTYKVSPAAAERLLRGLKIPLVEVGRKSEQ